MPGLSVGGPSVRILFAADSNGGGVIGNRTQFGSNFLRGWLYTPPVRIACAPMLKKPLDQRLQGHNPFARVQTVRPVLTQAPPNARPNHDAIATGRPWKPRLSAVPDRCGACRELEMGHHEPSWVL